LPGEHEPVRQYSIDIKIIPNMSILFAVLFYFATVVLVLGVASRVRRYAKTPAPLKIPTTPAPTTRGGVAFRMIKEVTIFESLFKSNKWIWLFGWLFHMACYWCYCAIYATSQIQCGRG